jgi:hypothetical protein
MAGATPVRSVQYGSRRRLDYWSTPKGVPATHAHPREVEIKGRATLRCAVAESTTLAIPTAPCHVAICGVAVATPTAPQHTTKVIGSSGVMGRLLVAGGCAALDQRRGWDKVGT